MLAREYCDDIGKKDKPIIISHHMLMGLTGEKMSKSDPNSAIFMEDTPADVDRKMKKAFCPEKTVEGNPILDYIKHIVLESLGSFTVLRKAENGGDKTYTTFDEIKVDYMAGDLHPSDLKTNCAVAVN